MRNTIFISHATPEDNEFTVWLASRLELLGYKTWIDKNELLGGEVFWDDIEDAIKNKSIKVLLVYSSNIIDKKKNGKLKGGIQKEINLAANVELNHPELKDYLILLNLDRAPYNLFTGSEDLNQIPFADNWASGLELLIKKFQKDKVPQQLTQNSEFSNWYLDHYLIKNPIIKKKELYYTNWWTVEHIPAQFYIFKFGNKEQAEKIMENNRHVLATLNANCIVSFEKELVFEITHREDLLLIEPSDIFEIKVSDILSGYSRTIFPTNRDAENYFKKLLKRILHVLFRNRKLNWYEQANKNLAYFHTIDSLPSAKVSFSYPHRAKINQKKKNLYGKYLSVGKWHFAISVKPILNPFLGFTVKNHLIFSADGKKAIDDKELQQSFRRKKGKRMFNEEWRDLLLAFLASLRTNSDKISISVSKSENLVMKNSVELFWSEYGYYDPKDLSRQSIFTYEFDEGQESEFKQISEIE